MVKIDDNEASKYRIFYFIIILSTTFSLSTEAVLLLATSVLSTGLVL